MSDDRVLVRVQAEPLSVDEALAAVADPQAGGTCVFVGTVRSTPGAGAVDSSLGADTRAGVQIVTGLTYEAWDQLAGQRLTEIARELVTRWPARRAAILHRTGDLAVGEASVVVAVSAPHRAEAFEACRHGIERLKQDVPIWKKESLDSGESHWVMGS